MVVRSVRIETSTAEGSDACKLRQQVFNPIHHRDDIGAGLPLNVDNDRRRVVHPGGLLTVFGAVDTVATSDSRTGAPFL